MSNVTRLIIQCCEKFVLLLI